MNKKSGNFLGKDFFDNTIIFEWQEIQGRTDELADTIKGLSYILIPAYAQTEVEFAQKKPEELPTDFMLRSLAPLLKQPAADTDWNLFQQKTENHLREFFATMDWKASSGLKDVHFFVVAKDEASGNALGAIQFFTTPDFEDGSIKAALSGVLPAAQNRGIEKLLMASIFALKPSIRRIFLHTRSTNTKAIDAYKQWGFTEFEGKLPHWTDLEYKADQCDELQRKSKIFAQ